MSSRAMLDALIAGERDAAVLAELAKGRMRAKIPALRDALAGRFDGHPMRREKAPDGTVQLRRQIASQDLARVESDRCSVLATDRHVRELMLLVVVEPQVWPATSAHRGTLSPSFSPACNVVEGWDISAPGPDQPISEGSRLPADVGPWAQVRGVRHGGRESGAPPAASFATSVCSTPHGPVPAP